METPEQLAYAIASAKHEDPYQQAAEQMRRQKTDSFTRKVGKSAMLAMGYGESPPGSKKTSCLYSLREACLSDASSMALGRAQDGNMIIMLHRKLRDEGPEAFNQYING